MTLLAAVGCGGSGGSGQTGIAGKSGDEIFSAAVDAVDTAKSVHVKGWSTNNTGQPFSFDLTLVAHRGGSGSFTVNGLSFDVVRIGDRAYFRGGVDFWTRALGDTEGRRLAGRWISSSATSGRLAPLSTLIDLKGLIGRVLEKHGELERGSQSTLDGQPVVLITDTTQGGSLYVATTGKPYPIKIVDTSAEGGALTFDKWDAPVTLTEPADSIELNLPGGV